MTAQQLIEAIRQADSEAHDSNRAYLDLGEPRFALIDGRLNLTRVAEILSALKAET